MNPLELMKIRKDLEGFNARHPMFGMFLQRAGLDIKEDTIIDIMITPPDGQPIKTNIKVSQEDLELINKLKNIRG